MVFEVVFFFVSLTVLGAWLFAREALSDFRRRYRGRRVDEMLAPLAGREVARAEALLGRADEVLAGSGGRRLYVWKAPRRPGIPSAAPLLIITITVDGAGIVTHAAWEER